MLACLVLALALGCLYAITAEREYLATAALQFDPASGARPVVSADQLAALRSATLAGEVLAVMEPARKARLARTLRAAPDGEQGEQALVGAIQARVWAEPLGSPGLRLHFIAPAADTAAFMANQYAESYVTLWNGAARALEEPVENWWREQRRELGQQRRGTDQRINELRYKLNATLDAEPPGLPAGLPDAASGYIEAHAQYVLRQRKLELAQAAAAQGEAFARVLVPEDQGVDAYLTSLREQVAASQAAREEQAQSPAVLDLRISATRSDLLRLSEMIVSGQALASLEQILTGRLRGARVFDTPPQASLVLARRAPVPSVSVTPVWTRALGLSLLLGTLAGLIAVVVAERFALTSRDAEELERRSGIRVLGALPLGGNRPAVLQHVLARPGSAADRAVEDIRAQLESRRNDDGSLVVVVSSALPDEGKTALSSNLASACARHGDTLLVDAHLTRPGLRRLGQRHGLTDFLAGSVDSADFLASIDPGGRLKVMSSGATPVDGDEFLAGRAMSEFIVQVRKRFETIVVDSASLASSPAAVHLAQQADAAVLAARAGRTSAPVVRRAAEQVQGGGGRVAGLVLMHAALAESPGSSSPV